MSNKDDQKEAMDKMKALLHSAQVKARWYSINPELLIPELIGLVVKTIVVAATLTALGVI